MLISFMNIISFNYVNAFFKPRANHYVWLMPAMNYDSFKYLLTFNFSNHSHTKEEFDNLQHLRHKNEAAIYVN